MRTPADRGRDLRRDLAPGDRRELAGNLVLGEARQADPADRILAGKRRKKRPKLVPPGALRVAVGGQDEQPCRADSGGQMPQQPQRRHIRPVQVIEHDEQAGAGCRVREELANRFEHLEPPLRRRTGLDRLAPQSGRDNSQVGPLPGSRVMDRGDVTDDLAKQPIRRAALILTGPGPHAPPPRRSRAGRRLLGHASLADPGLTADEHDPALTTAGRAHLRGEHRQFRLPPDEHRA